MLYPFCNVKRNIIEFVAFNSLISTLSLWWFILSVCDSLIIVARKNKMCVANWLLSLLMGVSEVGEYLLTTYRTTLWFGLRFKVNRWPLKMHSEQKGEQTFHRNYTCMPIYSFDSSDSHRKSWIIHSICKRQIRSSIISRYSTITSLEDN